MKRFSFIYNASHTKFAYCTCLHGHTRTHSYTNTGMRNNAFQDFLQRHKKHNEVDIIFDYIKLITSIHEKNVIKG